MHLEWNAGATDNREFAIMTSSGVLAASAMIEVGRIATRVEPGSEASRSDLDRLNAVNRVIEEAVETWGVADRVRRLALPTLLYDEVDLRHMRFLLLDDSEGEAVAFATWEDFGETGEAHSTRHLRLHGLYVLPHWQRRGLGSSLLEFVCLRAGMQGIDGILVRAWREAEAFFRRHGFETCVEPQSPESYSWLLWRS